MPFIIEGQTSCAISGRLLQKKDKIIGFPTFPCRPDEPEFICYEGVVLRDEFEKWYLKHSVINRVKDFWLNSYRRESAFVIHYQDDEFLLIKSINEPKARLHFLNHVLSIDILEQDWERVAVGLLHLSESDQIQFEFPWTTLSFHFAESVKICYDVHLAFGRDCIELTSPEFSHLQAVMIAKKDLFKLSTS